MDRLLHLGQCHYVRMVKDIISGIKTGNKDDKGVIQKSPLGPAAQIGLAPKLTLNGNFSIITII